ncbi:hypothetical protein J6590_059132 [Homalodisca vitripennis]|nr:hypothetical protein J6590_059132 [Homalodisca vitripennis]
MADGEGAGGAAVGLASACKVQLYSEEEGFAIFKVCLSDSLMFMISLDNGSGGSRKPAGSVCSSPPSRQPRHSLACGRPALLTRCALTVLLLCALSAVAVGDSNRSASRAALSPYQCPVANCTGLLSRRPRTRGRCSDPMGNSCIELDLSTSRSRPSYTPSLSNMGERINSSPNQNSRTPPNCARYALLGGGGG